MSSFDNTVCIREDILPEEQAYYIITMHRERLQHRRMSLSTQTAAGHDTPTNVQTTTQYSEPPRMGFSIQQNLNHAPAANIPTHSTAGLLKKAWDSGATAPVQGLPLSPQASMPHMVSAPTDFHTSVSNHAPALQKQPMVPLTRSSCLLGVCFR